MAYKGIDYLRRKLLGKRNRVLTRYKYYEMKNTARDISGIMPKEFRNLKKVIGWIPTSVDALADRISFDRFENDPFRLNEIYKQNNMDILIDDAVLSALISSCSFIYVSLGVNGYPRLQVIDGGNATGIIDPITRMLNEGYAVLERDEYKRPVTEAYFTKEYTEIYENKKAVQRFKNPAPFALLVPVINRPDAVRPFGHSRISRACMSLTQDALRVLKRTEVSSEFYSYPQKYVLGMSQDSEFNKDSATISNFLSITKDDDGDKPVVGQFTQQSMSPHIDELRNIASLFAGETGLTLDDLGFSTANPTAYDAIKASHETLRHTAEKAERSFGVGLLNAGYLAACLRDNYAYERMSLSDTTPTWRPVFDPDASTLGILGDAILKINQAIPDYLTADSIRKLTGIEGNKNEQ